MITLHEIQGSSQINGCGYDPVSQVLAIRFNSGAVYHYANVPPEIHTGIMAAAEDPEKSVGRFFGQNVKGKFEYKKQEPEVKPEAPLA